MYGLMNRWYFVTLILDCALLGFGSALALTINDYRVPKMFYNVLLSLAVLNIMHDKIHI